MRTKRRFSLSVSLLTTAMLASGCVHRAPSTNASTAGWVEVSLAEVGFRAMLPASPEIEREAVTADDGAPMTVVSGGVVAPQVLFGFRVLEDRAGFAGHPMNGNTFVDLASQGVAGASGGPAADWELLGESAVAVPGFVANDRTMLARASGVAIHVRTIIGRTRVYTVFVAHAADAESAMAPTVRAIFDSVSVDQADAVDPAGDGRLDTSRWSYVQPSDGAFAALLPGAARRVNGTIPIAAETHPVAVYGVEDGARRFEVVDVTLGRTATPSELDALSARMESGGLHERERHDIQLEGFFGRDVVFASDAGTVRSRFVVTADRIYELRVTAGPGAEAESPDAARFFDSFRIL